MIMMIMIRTIIMMINNDNNNNEHNNNDNTSQAMALQCATCGVPFVEPNTSCRRRD